MHLLKKEQLREQLSTAKNTVRRLEHEVTSLTTLIDDFIYDELGEHVKLIVRTEMKKLNL